MEGFGQKQYKHAWTRNTKVIPLEELYNHQRWNLPKLGLIVVKVEEIDSTGEDDNEELISLSN